MSSNPNLFARDPHGPQALASMAGVSTALPQTALGTVRCPACSGDVAPLQTQTGWQICPYCEKGLQIRVWPVFRQNTNAVSAAPEQATCFFHPEKAVQACCQRCGRFLCALCDFELGAEHVCPTCFERGRTDTGLNGGQAEWRPRDVLYDSIALAFGCWWILVWPVVVAALPAAIFLHVKYRKAPRRYLVPRSGWRFWAAYAGFAWLPLLIASLIFIPRWVARRH